MILVSIAASAIVAGYESIRKLINPEPMDYLGWVAAAAIVGFIGNEAVAILQIRTGRANRVRGLDGRWQACAD